MFLASKLALCDPDFLVHEVPLELLELHLVDALLLDPVEAILDIALVVLNGQRIVYRSTYHLFNKG